MPVANRCKDIYMKYCFEGKEFLPDVITHALGGFFSPFSQFRE